MKTVLAIPTSLLAEMIALLAFILVRYNKSLPSRLRARIETVIQAAETVTREQGQTTEQPTKREQHHAP